MKNIAINGRSFTSMALMLLFLCGFSLQLVQGLAPSSSSDSAQEMSAVTEANGETYSDVPPFLLLGVGTRLYSLPYTWPNEPKDTDQLILLHSGSSFLFYITGISYHYKKRLVFWCNSGGQITTGTFENRTKLTNVTTEQVISGSFFQPKVVGDLAVDWLHDKLYWTDRDGGRIEERDLNTNKRRTIVDSSDSETAAFNGLVMYPFPTASFGGWVYWTDNQQGKIERIAVNGEANTRQVIRGNLRACIWPMEIDYSEQSVLWVNTCTSILRSLRFGSDTDQSESRAEIDSSFSGTSSMTLFKDVLYWNEEGVVKATNKSIELGEVINIYEAPAELNAFSIAVEVVHPNKQPAAGDFLDIIRDNINMDMLNETCPPCVNGLCIPLESRCECHMGWIGENCTTDVDECELNASRCEQECHNTLGGFYCSCNSSFYLDSDGSTCIPVVPTSTIEPSVSSTGIGPEATTTGDHESTTIVPSSSPGPIHSTIIFSSSTLLPAVSSSDFMLMSSSSVTTEIFIRTVMPSFSLESSLSSSILLERTHVLPLSSSRINLVSTAVKKLSVSRVDTAALISSTQVYTTSTAYLGSSVATEQEAVSTTTLSTATTSSTLLSNILSTSIGYFSSLHTSLTPSLASRAVSPTPQPTSYTLSSSSAAISSSPVFSAAPSSSPIPISSTYATQSPPQMATQPQQTSTPTESLPEETDHEPSSNDMTLIVIVAAAGGSCAVLIIVVIIMIIAVVHYATKRCGSYTVNPDPSKESGAPSWIAVHSGSSKNHVNGLSGLSHQTKSSFKSHSPTCSTNSFA